MLAHLVLTIKTITAITRTALMMTIAQMNAGLIGAGSGGGGGSITVDGTSVTGSIVIVGGGTWDW